MIRGWCPGALRPMPSGDGLIVRLRLTGSILSPALAKRIGRWSHQWGNGLIDLSSRANLQLRGLSAHHLPWLWDALAGAGLLDPNADAEAVRNVIVSPLAGLDPMAWLDIRPIAAALEHRLVTDRSLHALPGKFGFAIDDGGLFSLDGVLADVRFVAGPGPAFRIHLAGAPDAFGPCAADAVPGMAVKIVHAFLRHQGARRMRDVAAKTIARDAGLARTQAPPVRSPHPHLGVQPLGDSAFLGIGLPFGRITAKDLSDLATMVGTRDLRLTPWRAILISAPSLAAAYALQAQLAGRSFIVDPDDPRRRVAACPGAPACPSATTRTRDDATTLAARVLPGGFLHVSGCEKGCAHPNAAAITLVGRDGRYDLIRNGAVSATPTARGLTATQAAEHIA
jgi:precorrin-3B synthase